MTQPDHTRLGQEAGNGTYTVMGGGAIGGTLAVHLARAGCEVQIVDADRAHVEAIRRDGLRIERPEGHMVEARIPAFHLNEGPAELGFVLLAVKSQATSAAMEWIAPRLRSDGCVASMQNGLNEAAVAEHIGVRRTVIAFVDLFADVLAPGVVADGGIGTIALGEYAGGASSRVHRLAEDLHSWGDPIVSANVAGFLWAKLAFGAMLTTTSFLDEEMASVVSRFRPQMLELAREVYAVSDAEGIQLESFDAFSPDDYRATAASATIDSAFDELSAWLAGQTKTRSGIWRDINVRKRPTEVPSQYEPVIALAASHGIETPRLQSMVDTIRDLERGKALMGDALMDRITVQGRKV